MADHDDSGLPRHPSDADLSGGSEMEMPPIDGGFTSDELGSLNGRTSETLQMSPRLDDSVSMSGVSSTIDGEDVNAGITISGATAKHLKKELVAARDGKRTMRRLSFAHGEVDEYSYEDSQLEYATISGARGQHMRDELNFATNFPTHGEVRTRNASQDDSALNVAEDDGGRREALLERRASLGALRLESQEPQVGDKNLRRCNDAVDNLGLLVEAVVAKQPSIGEHMRESLVVLRKNLELIDPFKLGQPSHRHRIKNIRLFAIQAARSRRKRWQRMMSLATPDIDEEEDHLKAEDVKIDIKDGESKYKKKKRKWWVQLLINILPVSLICILYFSVIVSKAFDETQHSHGMEDVRILPYISYLKPSPLEVIEVELVSSANAGGGGHRRRKLLRDLLVSSLPSNTTTCSYYSETHSSRVHIVSLQQGVFFNNTFVWTDIQARTLTSYGTGDSRNVARFRPEEANAHLPGLPLRVVIQPGDGVHQSTAHVQIFQYGWIGDGQRWIALTILLVVLVAIALEVISRVLAALVGSFLMIGVLIAVGRTPTFGTVISWLDDGTLGLLFGMMIMVGKLSSTGFFEVVTLRMIGLSRGKKWYLFIILCLLTAGLSAFLDNVTTVLLIAPATLQLCKQLEIDPMPFLISEILASNIGGAATMIGDPPNIIVGNKLSEIDFVDFIVMLAPGVVLIMPFALLLLRFIYKDSVTGTLRRMDTISAMQKTTKITNTRLFAKTSIVLGTTILLFLLHPVHHVDPAWIAFLGASALMLTSSSHDIHHDLEYVEWDTLIFFASLFVMVEAMVEVGLVSAIGDILVEIIASVPESRRLHGAIAIIVWVSSLLSGFLDNIPYTATMVPVIQQLANAGLGLSIKPLAWSLCLGACLGGNGSLVGASANIVVAGIAERMGYKISFIKFIKVSFPVMLLSVAIANAYLSMRYADE